MRSILRDLPLPHRTEIIPMGVDTERFSPGNLAPSRSKKMVYVGRVIRQKGIDNLVSAFARVVDRIPEARLEIIGHGPDREGLAERIDSSGIAESVILTDPIGHSDLPDRYRSARALALPSLIPEGLGMTALEAAACGVPTVTFGLGGTSEFVTNDETGLIVGIDDVALAQGIERIMTDDDLADRLGRNARQRAVESYGWDSISGKFDALYRSLIE
jgi:glycosyltransferase involved in cell wall biosynthesis